MSIGLLARDREGLEGASKEVEAAGGTPIAFPLDVADADAVDRAADAIETDVGPIDVWVNNAMVSVFSPVHELTPDEVRRVTDVTYLGTVHGTLSALRRMRPRDHGTIVQVSSTLAERSIPLQAAYCGAKHAIEGFTSSLRCELLHDRSGVRVSTASCGGGLLPSPEPPQGFAFQCVYTEDRSLDETMTVEDGDATLVPRGYHPCVGNPHGYDLYYLNVMAGPKRIWKFYNEPAHDWLLKARRRGNRICNYLD